MSTRDLADQLHSYMRFRAAREGVPYEFTAPQFRIHLRDGVRDFFGIETSDRKIIRDRQKPELLDEWQKLASPLNA